MIAVRYHTILESQNIIWPMSHTSRTCGCRRQNFLHDMSGDLNERCDNGKHIPNNQRCIKYDHGDDDCEDQPRDQAENGIGPWK